MDSPLTGFHLLPRGPRVRLRLAQVRDIPAIQALLLDAGSGLEAGSLVRIDPRRRIVICALALIDTTETVVGVAAMDAAASEPDLVCVDSAVTDGLGPLLADALASRARTIASRAA